MTKDDILGYTTPAPAMRDDLDVLASQHATADAISAKITETQRGLARAATWGNRCMMALVLPVALVVLAFVGLSLDNIMLAMGSMAAAMVSVCVVTGTGCRLDSKERYCKSVLESLQPIAGTDACQEALTYLEGDAPGVATWRGIALAERGQLYGFDVSIMRRLHLLEQNRLEWEQMRQAQENPVEDAERQRLNDEACRKVHGLAPLSPAGVQC